MTARDIASASRPTPRFPVRAALAHGRRQFLDLLAACSPARRRQKTQWETSDAAFFLRDMGIAPGDMVVDFGCGTGAYSIPAARLVGDRGLVISVDARPAALDRVTRRAARQNIRNIRTARSMEELMLQREGRACQSMLVFDVLHYMDQAGRKKLYDTFHGILGPDGVLLVHPKHVRGDKPSRHFRNTTVDDVVREIEASGFRLCRRKETNLWHGHGCLRGMVLIFRKRTEAVDPWSPL